MNVKTRNSKRKKVTSLNKLRRELSDEQKMLLNLTWQHYLKTGQWLDTFWIHRKHDKRKVGEWLINISGDIIYETQESSGNRYALSLLGALLTKDGEAYFDLLVRYLEFLRDKYVNDSVELKFTDEDVGRTLGLSDEQRVILGKLTYLEGHFRTYSQGDGHWGISVSKDIEDVPRIGSLETFRERTLLEHFDYNSPVLYQERHKGLYGRSSTSWPSVSSLLDAQVTDVPPELAASLKVFRTDYPAPDKTAFVMMRFGSTKAHNEILQTLRIHLRRLGISALRADDKDYHDDLFMNILTYIHGCGFGIAVFERLEREDFNPNISLEVGYMLALRKPVLLLKDKTLKSLNTDLIGRLYKTFDPQNISKSIAPQVQRWLENKEIID